MKEIIRVFNQNVQKMLHDQDGFLSQMKDKWEDKYIKIPIKAEMLLHLLKKNPIQAVSNLDVSFMNQSIIVSGIAKKVVSIAFYIELMPIRAEGRKLYFDITKMKPINQGWIKKKIFQNTSSISYIEGLVCIDLNEIDLIKAIKFGSIKSIEVKGDRLLVGIGI